MCSAQLREATPQSPCQPFRQAACVGENQRGPVADEFHFQTVDQAHQEAARPWKEDRGPQVGLRLGPQRFDEQLQRRGGEDMRDRASAVGAGQEMRRLVHRGAGGRQAYTLERTVSQVGQPLQAQGEVRAAFVGGQGVYFIDHDPAHVRQQVGRACLSQQHRQAFRRRQQDLGRIEPQVATTARRCIAGAQTDAEARPCRADVSLDAGQVQAEVLMCVVGQRFQGTEVETADGPDPLFRQQLAQDGQEGGEGLAAAGGGVDEQVFAAGDAGPGQPLGRRWRPKVLQNQRRTGSASVARAVAVEGGKTWCSSVPEMSASMQIRFLRRTAF